MDQTDQHNEPERRREHPLSESQVRHVVTEVFSEYIFRLDGRYASKEDVADLKRQANDQDRALTIAEQRFKGIDDKLEALNSIVSKVGWSIVSALLLSLVAQAITFGITH